MTIDFKKILQFLISLFIFTIPFQIKDIIFQSDISFGKFSPYLTFSIYFQDIIFGIILLLAAFLISRKELEIKINTETLNFNISIFLILYLLVHTLFISPNLLSLLIIFRFIELFFVFLLFESDIVNKNEIKVVFIITMLLQAFIALFQFIGQQSVGFSFLGESILNPDMLNIAKVDLNGAQYIRSYGTFPHPNILAFAFVLCIYFCMNFYKNFKILNFFLILFFIGALFLTLSRASIMCFALSLIVYYFFAKNTHKIREEKSVNYSNLALILFLIIASSFLALFNVDLIKERFAFTDIGTISERLMQIKASLMMIMDNPLGVGLGNFVIEMQKYVYDFLSPWQLQPVHNLILVLSSELGILFGIFILFIFIFNLYKVYKNKNVYGFSILFFVFLISNFDHFFYDIYSGQLLFVLALNAVFHDDA